MRWINVSGALDQRVEKLGTSQRSFMLFMNMERTLGTVMETSQDSAAVEVFKALGDPVRWSIIAQIAAVHELPCAELEQTLPVSKPTISIFRSGSTR